MISPFGDPLRPGQPDPLHTGESVEQQPDEFVSGESDSSAAGSSLRSWLPPRLHIEITGSFGGTFGSGGGYGYKWKEVHKSGDRAGWVEAGGGRDSDSLNIPAFEASLLGAVVPVGGVFEARLHESGEYLIFWVGNLWLARCQGSVSGSGASGSGSGAGCNGTYSGVIVYWDKPNCQFADLESCRMLPLNGETLVSGRRYPCARIDTVLGGVPLLVVLPGAAGGCRITFVSRICRVTAGSGSGSGSGG